MNVSEIQTFEHDVLVIGAGGAGLRAAIECSSRGLNTGVISKSLLGKAHTVMAEGGMAARLATWTDATTGRSTSATPCAAASSSTTGAWPSCTQSRPPTACGSSRSGGRCSIAPPTV